MLDPKRKYYQVVISSYVIFERDGQVLLARRYQTGYRDGEYGLPAGHIEAKEYASETAIREIKEEVGVDIAPADLIPVHIMHRHCPDHERVDFFFVAKKWQGELRNAEPEKCDDIRWFDFDKLPPDTIPYIRTAIEHYRAGKFFSEREDN